MKKSTLVLATILAAATAPTAAFAVNTYFSGTGRWSDSTKWTQGLPQAGDKAIIDVGANLTIGGDTIDTGYIVPKNNAKVVASDATINLSNGLHLGGEQNQTIVMAVTNSSVTAYETFIGQSTGGSISYLQKGGAYTSTRLFELQGLNPALVSFDSVATAFRGFRLVVGRGSADALLSFANGTFAANGVDILMGIGGTSTGRIGFKNEAISFQSGTKWSVGYSNGVAPEPSLVTMEDSVFDQKTQLNVGVASDSGTPGAKGLFVATDCAWTNSSGKSVFVGGGLNDSGATGHVILSNCVFKTATATANGYSFVIGQLRGTKGRLDIVGGTFDSATPEAFDTSNVMVGLFAGASGTLALHGRTLTSLPPYSSAEGSDSTLELQDCDFSKNGALVFGQKVNGVDRLHVLGGTFSVGRGYHLMAGKNNASDGGTSESEFVFDDATVTCDYLLAGRNSNHPGRIILRNGAVANCGSLYAGYEGTAVGAITNLGATVRTTQVYLGAAPGATAFYRDGEGAVTQTADFRAPHKGTAFAEIGGNVAARRFFVGVQGNYTGTVTVVDGAYLDVTNDFFVGINKLPGIATLELKGGVVHAPYVQRFNSGSETSGMSSHVYFNGGTLKARKDQSSEWISSYFTTTAISDGGAVFDSDGHSVTASATLVHDPREGAAAKDGGLTKKGAGMVKLMGTLTFNGDIRVEAGTLDLSRATYSMGASAGLSGSGTLMAPAGGLTCGGKVLLDASRGTLTVDGALTLGGTATVEVENPETLDRERSYTILTATSLSGTPTAANLPEGWRVSKRGSSIKLSYDSATVFLVK